MISLVDHREVPSRGSIIRERKIVLVLKQKIRLLVQVGDHGVGGIIVQIRLIVCKRIGCGGAGDLSAIPAKAFFVR